MKKKIPFFLLFCLFIQVLTAQKKVILEYIRCQSIKGPVMDYWQKEDIRRIFAGQLNSFLLKYHHLPLADTAKLNIQIITANSQSDKSALNTSDGDTANLHMYLTIFESTPRAFFSRIAMMTPEDSTFMNHAKSIFLLKIILVQKDSIVFNNTLDIIISAGNTPGIGIVSNTVTLTAKGFSEMLKTGMNLLLNPENNLAQIEVKVAPAFVADNYILPKTMQRPRVYVSTTKDISSYRYHNSEMIRLGEAIYEQIRGKGKKTNKLPAAIEEAIRNTNHFSVSDYVFLHQDCRDVMRNKNYLLKLLVQIDPENPPSSAPFLFTGFLKGNIHYLFNEKDTVAIFAIEKKVTDPDKKIYIDKITNGFDSASLFLFDTSQPAWSLIYDYVVNGKIGKQNFSIKCTGVGNTLKEIYLDDKLICIAQGKFSPEKFVFFDAPLSPELFNQLLMIGFNRFFE